MTQNDPAYFPEGRRTYYGVVAVNAASLAVLLLSTSVQLIAQPRQRPLPLMFYGSLLITLTFAGILVAGIALEVRQRRAALFVNLGWSLFALIATPVSIFIEASKEALRPGAALAISVLSAIPFAVLFVLIAFLYRSTLFSFRQPQILQVPLHQGNSIPIRSASSERRDAFGKLAVWLSPPLTVYPVVLLFLLRGDYLSKRSAAGFELFLFIACLLTVMSLAFSFRNEGKARFFAIALSVLALGLNFCLMTLISLSV